MQEMRVISEPDVMRLVVNSQLPAAEAFEKLVFEEILPTIRKTGRYGSPALKATPAPKVFTEYFRVARLIGLDKNVAAVSANQAVVKLTGTNVLSLLGQTQLETPDQKVYLTPTEIGKKMSPEISARSVNIFLEHMRLQTKDGDKWVPTKAAAGLYRVFDTGKSHNTGVMVQQVKWSTDVIGLQEESTQIA